MPITTTEALALKRGDVVTDGTAEYTVTFVSNIGGGKFRIEMKSDVQGTSFFTHDHLDMVSKVVPGEPDAAPVATDESTETPSPIPEPTATEDLPAFENGVGWVDDSDGDPIVDTPAAPPAYPKGKGKGK